LAFADHITHQMISAHLGCFATQDILDLDLTNFPKFHLLTEKPCILYNTIYPLKEKKNGTN